MTHPLSMTYHRSETFDFGIEQVASAFSSRWPERVISNLETDEAALSMEVDGTPVILGLMSAAVPWKQLEPVVESSFLWPEDGEARAALKEHRSHVICTLASDLDPVATSELLTQVTWSVLQADPDAMGVYWDAAEMVIHRPIFCEFVSDVMPSEAPVLIWVKMALGPSPEQQGMAGFTTGMQALGHMELETLNSSDSAGELMDRFTGLACYLLENGPVIADGDAIGGSGAGQVKVQFADSCFGNDGQVMRLLFTDAPKPQAKPWWKFW